MNVFLKELVQVLRRNPETELPDMFNDVVTKFYFPSLHLKMKQSSFFHSYIFIECSYISSEQSGTEFRIINEN